MSNIKEHADSEKKKVTGKAQWQDMLQYVEALHKQSVKEAEPPFTRAWEHIGPGYCYGPAFGHWDIIHSIFDALCYDQDHAILQMQNALELIQEDGMLPMIVWMREGEKGTFRREATHPPVWVFAADQILGREADEERRSLYIETARSQIGWFEENRKAIDGGYYYTDILNHVWESGVDEGIRFIQPQTGKYTCIDATSHVYALYHFVGKWMNEAGDADCVQWQEKAEALKKFIQEQLYSEEEGFFYDSWSVNRKEYRHFCYEAFWPVIVGAATQEQAERVIREHMINEKEFFTKHPIPTVVVSDSLFEKRMWRGPAWNSMTMWAARGCMRYGFYREAADILEAALDDSSEKFETTGNIWEFYDSLGELPTTVTRKPDTPFNIPCKDYLGHNPLLTMASLWDVCRQAEKA